MGHCPLILFSLSLCGHKGVLFLNKPASVVLKKCLACFKIISRGTERNKQGVVTQERGGWLFIRSYDRFAFFSGVRSGRERGGSFKVT